MPKSKLAGLVFHSLLGLVILFVLCGLSLSMLISLCAVDNDGRIAITEDHILVYQGGTSAKNLQTLKEILNGPKAPIESITIESGGGNTKIGLEIAQVLKNLGNVSLRVDAKHVCASACVEILSEMPDRIVVAPTATILFHAQIWRPGEARCPLCDVVHAIRMAIELPTMSKAERHVMADWADKLSPRLNELMALCKVNPLDTYTGVTLSGAEFNGLIDGSIAPTVLTGACPEHNVFYPQREDERLSALIDEQGTR